MSNSDSISLLRTLSRIISDGVDKIDKTCIELQLQFPSLDEPFTPANHAPHLNPQINEAVSTIVAATAQITAIVQPAPVSLLVSALQVRILLTCARSIDPIGIGLQFGVSAAIRTVLVTNTVEILREAGPQAIPAVLHPNFPPEVVYLSGTTY